MPATCPECSWPAPTLVSAHGDLRYLRCVCGKWLIEEHAVVIAAAGDSAFAESGDPARAGIGHAETSSRLRQ
ncbi:hypothetical protein GPX89_36840 [Nocardia sp. ET3-3]|uniref:Uncharacterized protein n=1 Tax=Nocardia terrae TaxID=2675851 RepID=A0A7K1V8K5_9NOCA|nr:hypothetical protein [Nocardia terrae]MVU82789.1 hypothetical protein [Nocardia terrae]